MSDELKKRHVAVIGASTGIGLATAQMLVQRGARVTIGGRSQARLDAAAGALGDRARAVVVDAEDGESLRHFFSEAGEISDLVVTVTRRGGAGPASELADADLAGAFGGKTIAHLRALALALPTLSGDRDVGWRRFSRPV